MIKRLGPKKASELGGGNHDRWRSVSKGAVRVSTEEIDVLVKAYPHYALWLACGQIAPEIGQTSPAYDDTHPDLSPSSAD
ncbi:MULTISPECIES: DNA-binding protein [Pseudomonadaceae]|uniref:DNA-binding protein n=1 Tax=Pseudomonadaceae TaxID=135621 RepID=UPI0009F41595|nr:MULTISPECIES: DNA-binding protein [Pseudomonas]